MKKSICNVLLIAVVLIVVCFSFVGCGDNEKSDKEDNNKSNVVDVSKEKVIHGEYIRGGGYDSTIEMTFSEENKLTKMVLSYDCATEADAQRFYNDSLEGIKETDTDMKINGKNVTITMSAEGYMKMSGVTEDKIDEGTMRQIAMGMGYSMKN